MIRMRAPEDARSAAVSNTTYPVRDGVVEVHDRSHVAQLAALGFVLLDSVDPDVVRRALENPERFLLKAEAPVEVAADAAPAEAPVEAEVTAEVAADAAEVPTDAAEAPAETDQPF